MGVFLHRWVQQLYIVHVENNNTFCTVPSNVSEKGNISYRWYILYHLTLFAHTRRRPAAVRIKSSNRLLDVLVLCRCSTSHVTKQSSDSEVSSSLPCWPPSLLKKKIVESEVEGEEEEKVAKTEREKWWGGGGGVHAQKQWVGNFSVSASLSFTGCHPFISCILTDTQALW